MAVEVKPTMVSLFAGAGGLDLGLEQAGFESLLATDSNPVSCASLIENQALGHLDLGDFEGWLKGQLGQRCYSKATPGQVERLRDRLSAGVGDPRLARTRILCRDVRELSSSEVLETVATKAGQVDLVAGGPPCQPFSRAGKRKTVDTGDGQLFLEFVRLVEGIAPRWVLFENVKGLAQSKTDIWWVSCRGCGEDRFPPFDPHREAPSGFPGPCSRCGSDATVWEVRKGMPGGSLQLILEEFERIGYRCDWRILNAADFGLPQFRERVFIVGSRDGEKIEWPSATHGSPSVVGENLSFFEEGLAPYRDVQGALWPEGHPFYGKLGSEARLWVKNVVRPHDEPVTWSLDRPSPTVGAHQAAKLALAPRGVPPEQLFRQQWHTKGRRQGDTPPVKVEHQYLDDEELLLLQGFPRSWYLHGTRMQRAFQIGNAVPPALARILATSAFGVGAVPEERAAA